MAERLLDLPDETAMARLGQVLDAVLPAGAILYLEGPLGAGKTTLVRALLRAMGHAGRVRSPSYSLLEPYAFEDRQLLHLDLYRIGDPGELDALGLRELLADRTRVCIEWPERGGDQIPSADLRIALDHAEGGGRMAVFSAADPTLLDKLTVAVDAT